MGEYRIPVEWEKEREFAAVAAAVVGRAVTDHFLTTLHTILEIDCARCESEHERLFLLAWISLCERVRCTALFSQWGDQTRWAIVRPEMHNEDYFARLQETDFIDCDGARHDWIAPQYPLEGKPVDFLLLRFDFTLLEPKDPDRKRRDLGTKWKHEKEVLRQCRPVVVEIGSEPGSRQRDRELQALGYSVARFSGPELVADPFKCAEEVDALLSPELCHDQWRRPKPAARPRQTGV